MKNPDRSKLIAKFHTLLKANGIDKEGKEAIYESYGVSSCTEMNMAQLKGVVSKLEISSPEFEVMHQWRRKVLGVLGKYFGKQVGIDYLKGIAEKAAGVPFNKISKKALNRIYYEFKKKLEAKQAIDESSQEFGRNMRGGVIGEC